MVALVNRVVNGRIFQNIASRVRRDNRSTGGSVDQDSWLTRNTNSRPVASPVEVLGTVTVPSDFENRNRGRQKVEMQCVSNFDVAPLHRPGMFGERGSDIAMTGPQNRFPVPVLISRDLKIFTYPGDGDEGAVGTGLALTEKLVWELNAIYQAQGRIATYTSAIAESEDVVEELQGLIADFQARTDQSDPKEDQSGRRRAILDAEELLQAKYEEVTKLRSKSQHWRDEMEIAMSQMLSSSHSVLASSNLLRNVLDESNNGIESPEGEGNAPSPSPSEMARQEKEVQRQEAFEIIQERRFQLEDAQAKIANWNAYYDDAYSRFRQLLSEGSTSATKTEFDIDMLRQGQVATRDLMRAEKELDKTVEWARRLRLDCEEFDQESGFLSQVEDGQIESMDPGQVPRVDRQRIKRWMGEGDEKFEEAVSEIDEQDDWECRTVGVEDSISIVATQVATGKERKRIDRWRSMCGAAEVIPSKNTTRMEIFEDIDRILKDLSWLDNTSLCSS